MDEYINREDVLKCLEYNTIQKPSANDVVSATLRVAREKVGKLPVAQKEAPFSFWRDPDKNPPFLSGVTLTRTPRKSKKMC